MTPYLWKLKVGLLINLVGDFEILPALLCTGFGCQKSHEEIFKNSSCQIEYSSQLTKFSILVLTQ